MGRVRTLLALLTAGACACNTAPPELPGPTRHDTVDVDDGGRVDVLAPPPSRSRRRMEIGQLDAAIRSVTGGIGWTEDGDDMFVELASSLGVPDYAETTQEDLEPNETFQKFLGDAARAVCTELVEREAKATAAERVLLLRVSPGDTVESAPEAVEANLSELLLRYHGTDVAPGSPELVPWRWLFETTNVITGDPMLAWRAVCVGLITHPGFHTY
jgi:hypothetical protein